jgi:hypothetical protein
VKADNHGGTRHRRRLLSLAGVLLGTTASVCVVLWGAGLYAPARVGIAHLYHTPDTLATVGHEIAWGAGRLVIARQVCQRWEVVDPQYASPVTGFYYERLALLPDPSDINPVQPWPASALLRWAMTEDDLTPREWAVSVPCWLVVTVAAPYPLFRLARRFQRCQWLRDGRCRLCGYDLRASRGRCPECGAGEQKVPFRSAEKGAG